MLIGGFIASIMIMKKLLFLFWLCLFSLSGNAQTAELTFEKGVAAHKEIDAIYAQFSEAYRTLDVEKAANLYTENAAYLVPSQAIQTGRAQVRENFKSFFDYVKNENRTLTISFQIFQRKCDKNMAYDVGIYTLRQFKNGTEVGTGQGKFVVVALRDKDKKWRFQVDGYSDLKPPEKD